VLRLARLVGLGRAKELTLLNPNVTPAEARAMGLVNWVCAPGEVDATLARIVDKVRAAAPTATAHAKRLLHESFHTDPRRMIEEIVRVQNACMATWETAEANRAWQDKREARYYPPPPGR
jgi:enoyl-CoA hydratase/carnithine racemase